MIQRFKSMLADLTDILFRSDTRLTRLMLASGAIVVALGFAWPVHIFPTFEQLALGQGRHTYSLMAQIAPEWAWATAFGIQGTVMLYSVLSNKQSKTTLWLDAALGALIWTVAVLACYLAYWRGFDRIMEYRPPAIMGGEAIEMMAAWLIFLRYQCGGKK